MKAVAYPNNRPELKVGNVTYRSFYDNRETKDDLELASLELSETEEVKSASLQELKDMLIHDKEFCYRLEDEYLLRYLRFRKYDVKKAYTALRKFYAFRKERPDLFVIPSNLDFLLSRDILKCLPYKEKGGNPIYWIDTNMWKLDEVTPKDIFTLVPLYADIMSLDPGNLINGTINLYDVGGVTAAHIYRYANPSLFRTYLKILMSNYPWRVKQVIVVNCSQVLKGIVYIFKLLLSRKIADRIIMIGSDVKELHKYIDPCLLPKVYGGCIETSECRVQQFIEDNLPYIRYERSFGSSTKD